jgi:hypothetical protein
MSIYVKKQTQIILNNLLIQYPQLNGIKDKIVRAADSEHIVREMMKVCIIKRPITKEYNILCNFL